MPITAEREINPRQFASLDSSKKTIFGETRPFTPNDWVFSPSEKQVSSIDFVKSQEKKEIKRPHEGQGMKAWIDYFDSQWRKESLPEDWHNLKTQNSKRVGFIIDQQLAMLRDPADRRTLFDWTQKTKRDLEGFKLEFLSDNVVYPRKYIRNPNDPTRLEDPFYGNIKEEERGIDIQDLVSEQERNGSVKESVGKVKEFLLNAPDGSLAVVTSPLGPTGFKTQDGLAIDYPDSYFFVMQRKGNEVMNYTLKTDFKFRECREVIYQLTGKKLSLTSPLEDYVKTVALIKPGEHSQVTNVIDVTRVLERIQTSHAFKDTQNAKTTTWEEVRNQMNEGEKLYEFDRKTQEVIAEFEAYAQQGEHTKEELKKAIAVAILRMGELFFKPKEKSQPSGELQRGIERSLTPPQTFGAILEQTAQRRGCSGGGKSSGGIGGSLTISSLISRSAIVGGGSSQEWFTCPECRYKADGPVGDRCPGCGLTKEAYAEKAGQLLCD